MRGQEDVLILIHHHPDGDAIGSGYGLYFALSRLGIRSRVACADPIPPKYGYMTEDVEWEEFEPACVVAVDVADPQLLGDIWNGRVDLCIDHHISNTGFAQRTLLDSQAPAAAQILCRIVREWGIEGDSRIADAVFTGLSTDTGCFQYGNVTPECHRTAALMIEWGARHALINKLMFGTKSRARLESEKEIMDTLRYAFQDKCAVVTIPFGLEERYQLEPGELEGIASLPREIEGVEVGVTLRQIGPEACKVSLRSSGAINVSNICKLLGGGGHPAAAGCTLTGSPKEVGEQVLEKIGLALNEQADYEEKD